MRLRQNWLAVSPSKQTIMFSTISRNVTLPLLLKATDEVTLTIGRQDRTDLDDVWLAISQENLNACT